MMALFGPCCSEIFEVNGRRTDMTRFSKHSAMLKPFGLALVASVAIGCSDDPSAGNKRSRAMSNADWPDAARTIFKVAEDEARFLGHDFIGPEHLVLAILKLDSAANGWILTSKERDQIQREVLRGFHNRERHANEP